ncbi:hypothetical protein H6F89_17440 [Cyanobacteria bacterium FACHB-63]|nr:hypothetical protein [Cyanobacteria bacterium FACHB-63]
MDDSKQFLLSLEDRLGGERTLLAKGSGDIFLSPVSPAIGLVASFVVAPLIRKYLDGLLDGDALEELGESHREEVASWFFKLEEDITTIVAVTDDLLKDYPNAFVCRRQQTDLVLTVDLGSSKLGIVLNKYHPDEARETLPNSIVKAVKYIVENQVEGSLGDFSLQYDSQSEEWYMHVTMLIKLSERS